MPTAIPSATQRKYLLSDRFRPFPHVVWARHADATVLLDAERGQYYTLNEVAGRGGGLGGGGETGGGSPRGLVVAGGEPVVEILRLLGEEYDAPAERLEGDVAGLLDRLIEAELIVRGAT